MRVRSDKRLEGKAGGIGNSLCDGEGVEARKRNDTYAFFLVCPWHKASDHLERGLRFRGDILLVRRRRGYLLDCHYRMIYTLLGYGCGKSRVKGNFGSEGKEHVKTCSALRRVIGDMAMKPWGCPIRVMPEDAESRIAHGNSLVGRSCVVTQQKRIIQGF